MAMAYKLYARWHLQEGINFTVRIGVELPLLESELNCKNGIGPGSSGAGAGAGAGACPDCHVALCLCQGEGGRHTRQSADEDDAGVHQATDRRRSVYLPPRR